MSTFSEQTACVRLGDLVTLSTEYASLQTGCAYPLEAVSLIRTQHHGLERALHRKYAAQRQLGEWYALSEADIEWINTFASTLPSKPHAQASRALERIRIPPRPAGRCFSWVNK